MWVKSILQFSIYSIFIRLTKYHTIIYCSIYYLFCYLSTFYLFYTYLQLNLTTVKIFSGCVGKTFATREAGANPRIMSHLCQNCHPISLVYR